MPSASDFNFLQKEIEISVKFGAHNPPLGKDTKLGHSCMVNLVREVRSKRDLSDAERDSKLLESQISIDLSFGKNSNGKDQSEPGPLFTFKLSIDG